MPLSRLGRESTGSTGGKEREREIIYSGVFTPRSFLSGCDASELPVGTLVLRVGLVEDLGVDEAHPGQAQGVLLGQQVGLAVSQLLVGHQGVVAVADPHVGLQVSQLLGHLCLLPLQELWGERQRHVMSRSYQFAALCSLDVRKRTETL